MFILVFSLHIKPLNGVPRAFTHILADEGYGLVVLEKRSTEAIFAGTGLQDKGLDAVIISQSHPEKHIANPVLQAVKSLICGGVPVLICYLFPEEGSFGCKAREKGLQIVN